MATKPERFNYTIGNRLPNGAIILAFSEPVVSYGYRVVLAWWANNPQPFVTWCCAATSGDAFWGTYHATIMEGVKRFLERCQEKGCAV